MNKSVAVAQGDRPQIMSRDGDRILNSFTPLHYGTFGGIPTRILYVFVGLAPTVLLVTGFFMWRYRKLVMPKKAVREVVWQR